MNTRAFTLSLVIAGIAMFMVYAYIGGKEAEFANKYGKESPVVVASIDIKANELIDDRKVTVINVPTKFRAPGHIKDVKEILNTIASVPIKKGEQITKPRVTYPGVKTGLSRHISPGKRAISIPAAGDTAVSQLIKPLDRVDIVAFFDYAGGAKEKTIVETVLQDVLVLATDLNVSNSIPLVGMKTPREVRLLNLDTITRYSYVTLEVTQYQAQKIEWLRQSGAKLTMTLRNNDDKKKVEVPKVGMYDVLSERGTQQAKRYFLEKSQQGNNRGRR